MDYCSLTKGSKSTTPDNNGINTILNIGKNTTGDCNLKKQKTVLTWGPLQYSIPWCVFPTVIS